MNEIASLPSMSELLSQNPNLKPNASVDRFMQSSEMGANLGSEFLHNTGVATGVNAIDVDPVNRVTAPGFADMFEKFIKGVDRKKKVAKNEVQDLILGKSDNIHEAMVKVQEAGVAFNLMIQVRNKLVDSYKELMRMQV
jgi:flagellar hook-basal body complex protein FliE